MSEFKELKEGKELIIKAQLRDKKALEELFTRFKPLLRSQAKRWAKAGLEYEEVFQQASLLFILSVYDYDWKRRNQIPFAGYIKKRIIWGLWSYYRKHLRQQKEIPSGLNPEDKGESKDS